MHEYVHTSNKQKEQTIKRKLKNEIKKKNENKEKSTFETSTNEIEFEWECSVTYDFAINMDFGFPSFVVLFFLPFLFCFSFFIVFFLRWVSSPPPLHFSFFSFFSFFRFHSFESQIQWSKQKVFPNEDVKSNGFCIRRKSISFDSALK